MLSCLIIYEEEMKRDFEMSTRNEVYEISDLLRLRKIKINSYLTLTFRVVYSLNNYIFLSYTACSFLFLLFDMFYLSLCTALFSELSEPFKI